MSCTVIYRILLNILENWMSLMSTICRIRVRMFLLVAVESSFASKSRHRLLRFAILIRPKCSCCSILNYFTISHFVWLFRCAVHHCWHACLGCLSCLDEVGLSWRILLASLDSWYRSRYPLMTHRVLDMALCWLLDRLCLSHLLRLFSSLHLSCVLIIHRCLQELLCVYQLLLLAVDVLEHVLLRFSHSSFTRGVLRVVRDFTFLLQSWLVACPRIVCNTHLHVILVEGASFILTWSFRWIRPL